MSVRDALLSILAEEPCYGYQLRAEFDRRTGSSWPLNVGQTYSTLDRLVRDGLVERGETDAEGQIPYSITPAGRAAASAWFASPVDRTAESRDDLAVKLAIAATLGSVDAAAVVAEQRRASAAEARDLERRLAEESEGAGAEGLARRVMLTARLERALSDLRLLDRVGPELVRLPDGFPLDAASARPRRGRPPKTV